MNMIKSIYDHYDIKPSYNGVLGLINKSRVLWFVEGNNLKSIKCFQVI